jgi:hypothetical protein
MGRLGSILCLGDEGAVTGLTPPGPVVRTVRRVRRSPQRARSSRGDHMAPWPTHAGRNTRTNRRADSEFLPVRIVLWWASAPHSSVVD